MSSSVDEGKALQAAAYATSPIEPKGLGPVINAFIVLFLVLAFIITSLRAYVRFSSGQKWGWDDILAIGGYVSSSPQAPKMDAQVHAAYICIPVQAAFVPSNVFGILATQYGLGAPDADITDLLEIRAVEYFMYYEILYFAASATTKVSITLTVLRLCEKQPIYRRIAIGNAVMMIVAALVAGVFVLSNCRPFDTYWNPDLYVSPETLET